MVQFKESLLTIYVLSVLTIMATKVNVHYFQILICFVRVYCCFYLVQVTYVSLLRTYRNR